MKHTGIFATPEELATLKEAATNARNTPAITFSVQDGIDGNDWASVAHRNVRKACHMLALQHGLPEVRGYYGITLDTGEFVEAE